MDTEHVHQKQPEGIYKKGFFAPNPKCIVFGAAVVGYYWYCSKQAGKTNHYLFPLIFLVAYILMAWYDYIYNCDRMYSGSYGPMAVADSIFKPQYRDNMVDDQQKMYDRNVYLVHAVAIAPLLIYMGMRGIKADPRLFPVLSVLGTGALAYHGYQFLHTQGYLGA